MQPTDILLAAEDLLKVEEGAEPREANLRKACSATYYAIFHTLCEACADMLVDRSAKHTWTHVYRAVDHMKAKTKCLDGKVIGEFPEAVQKFAEMFVTMQVKRHRADYDPNEPGDQLTPSEVSSDIIRARAAMEAFCAVEEQHRLAFAAYIFLGKART